jgi:hypothetical protein
MLSSTLAAVLDIDSTEIPVCVHSAEDRNEVPLRKAIERIFAFPQSRTGLHRTTWSIVGIAIRRYDLATDVVRLFCVALLPRKTLGAHSRDNLIGRNF